eukprot:gene9985-biopygen3154
MQRRGHDTFECITHFTIGAQMGVIADENPIPWPGGGGTLWSLPPALRRTLRRTLWRANTAASPGGRYEIPDA